MAGRARSIWDAFCEESGRIVNGDTGDVACDHYSLYEEDIKIMKVRHRRTKVHEYQEWEWVKAAC